MEVMVRNRGGIDFYFDFWFGSIVSIDNFF
jgi:hypothetical protein